MVKQDAQAYLNQARANWDQRAAAWNVSRQGWWAMRGGQAWWAAQISMMLPYLPSPTLGCGATVAPSWLAAAAPGWRLRAE